MGKLLSIKIRQTFKDGRTWDTTFKGMSEEGISALRLHVDRFISETPERSQPFVCLFGPKNVAVVDIRNGPLELMR